MDVSKLADALSGEKPGPGPEGRHCEQITLSPALAGRTEWPNVREVCADVYHLLSPDYATPEELADAADALGRKYKNWATICSLVAATVHCSSDRLFDRK